MGDAASRGLMGARVYARTSRNTGVSAPLWIIIPLLPIIIPYMMLKGMIGLFRALGGSS